MDSEKLLNFSISQVLNSYISDMKASLLSQDLELKKKFADKHADICRQFLEAVELEEFCADTTVGRFMITPDGVTPL